LQFIGLDGQVPWCWP